MYTDEHRQHLLRAPVSHVIWGQFERMWRLQGACLSFWPPDCWLSHHSWDPSSGKGLGRTGVGLGLGILMVTVLVSDSSTPLFISRAQLGFLWWTYCTMSPECSAAFNSLSLMPKMDNPEPLCGLLHSIRRVLMAYLKVWPCNSL